MKAVLFLAALIGVAYATDSYAGDGYKNYERDSYNRKLVYRGRYSGKCGNDGFYYNDKESFIICSNGNAYTQRCAPGSVNSGYSQYEYGRNYYYHDFCDVNLVDEGYAARRAGYDGYNDGYRGYRENGYKYDGGYGYREGYNDGKKYGYDRY